VNRAVRKVAQNKPVVASIGSVAASGGYYIAVGADHIFATRGAVTGSIGIWFGKFVVSGLLDMLKIHRVKVDRGRNASLLTMDRELTPEELEAVLVRLTEIYELFVKRVAEARKMSEEEVDALGQGRVWSGERALMNGLVDTEGGSLEALLHLQERSGLGRDEKVDLVYFPRLSLSARLTRALTGGRIAAGEEPHDWTVHLPELLNRLTSTHIWALEPSAGGGW